MTTALPVPKKRTRADKKWDAAALTTLLATYELLRRQTGHKREAICEVMASDDYAAATWNRGGQRLNAATINKTLTYALSLEHNPVTPLFLGKPDSVDVIKRRLKERAKAEGCASRLSDRDFIRIAREIRANQIRTRRSGADLIIEKMAWKHSST
jgi:hypothetical protein